MKLIVISGGLREPSSTRLLADRLGAAVRAELGLVDMEVDMDVIGCRRQARSGLSSFPRADAKLPFSDRN